MCSSLLLRMGMATFFASGFGHYLETGEFGDVVLLGEAGERFVAHRLVLAYSSPHFARLLLGPPAASSQGDPSSSQSTPPSSSATGLPSSLSPDEQHQPKQKHKKQYQKKDKQNKPNKKRGRERQTEGSGSQGRREQVVREGEGEKAQRRGHDSGDQKTSAGIQAGDEGAESNEAGDTLAAAAQQKGKVIPDPPPPPMRRSRGRKGGSCINCSALLLAGLRASTAAATGNGGNSNSGSQCGRDQTAAAAPQDWQRRLPVTEAEDKWAVWCSLPEASAWHRAYRQAPQSPRKLSPSSYRIEAFAAATAAAAATDSATDGPHDESITHLASPPLSPSPPSGGGQQASELPVLRLDFPDPNHIFPDVLRFMYEVGR